jgi:excinuclease ABC subunit A
VRSTISVHGAREHNLKDVSLDIPRDQLVVFTGVSGSGKSSLAFDTIYAEGQRRYMESLSRFARNFVEHLPKPDVDFLHGLSPVISIEQKTAGRNPRSTVGTMTDVASYLNLLYASSSQAHCPHCAEPVTVRTTSQIVEAIMALPAGTSLELRAPVFPVYGEDLEFLFTEVRKKGCRFLWLDGQCLDLSESHDLENVSAREMLAVTDRLVVKRGGERQVAAAVDHALDVGERFVSVWVDGRPLPGHGCQTHGTCAGDLTANHFMFNDPTSACRTCLGVGSYKQAHVSLLIPDPRLSLEGGAFVPEAFRYNPDNWDGVIMWSLAQRFGFRLDTPWSDLSEEAKDLVLFGSRGEEFPIVLPPNAKVRDRNVERPMRFEGIIHRIERQYRRYRQDGQAHAWMDAYLNKVMVDFRCPDCQGARLRPQRLHFKIDGRDVHEAGAMNFSELRAWLAEAPLVRSAAGGGRVQAEILGRLDLLLGIGLDYLSLGRAATTLSGGEAQRIRLSTQIGSGLMGMLYVLDEPSIGLHPKDNEKMIGTLRRLRDLGNTVIVVEHDEDTMRAADFLVEMGPGPGVHGGKVVVAGPPEVVLAHETSLTAQYLTGRRRIEVPSQRRPGSGKELVVRGGRENNLRNVDVAVPLGKLVCVTGASGSGKSTLVNDILYKRLYAHFYDSRTLAGEHDAIEGLEHLSDVVAIDQTPIGRSPRSNPATYVGVYDGIRDLFAAQPEAQARGYTRGRFSFNVKGGRCEECQGEGTVTTQLHFMPDVEVRCEVCKGARFNAETLEITLQDKNIAEVLDMPIEDGVRFFAAQPAIRRRLQVLDELGLGYLTLGQSATTLSGGEAQRVKLATHLAKLRRGERVLYILDEPTTGLHLADVERLLESINRLVDAGHTVLVIEHHLDVIKTADHVIDLGPEGGHAGGEVVATGKPEEVAAEPNSYTGRYLLPLLARSKA